MESDIGFDRHNRPLAIVFMKACEARRVRGQGLGPRGVGISSASSGSPDMMVITLSAMSR